MNQKQPKRIPVKDIILDLANFVEDMEKAVPGEQPTISMDELTFLTFKQTQDRYFEPILYAIGVLMTGMGQDGAQGMKTIKKNNGRTIVQNKKSCTVFGMPKAAIDMKAADKVVPLKNIAEELIRMLQET